MQQWFELASSDFLALKPVEDRYGETRDKRDEF